MVNYFFKKLQMQFNTEIIVFSTDIGGVIQYPYAKKKNFDLNFTLYIKLIKCRQA